jgi:uncharacterized protein (DUF2147 family)
MLKKTGITLLAIFSISFAAFSQTNNADLLIGKWLTKEQDVIEFYKKGDNYEGKIVTTADKKQLQIHPEIVGTTVFTALQLKNNQYNNGWYYDLEAKKSYPVKIAPDGTKRLKVTFGSGFLTETHVFNRIN